MELTGFAVGASKIGLDLSADTDAVAHFDRLHVLADLDSATNDFVPNTEWQWHLPPTAGDGVDV
ncbi:hypothetical protein Tdes44962_MAKER00341 [Teratosphaeria destructans]|uniref:Uncharacterized protein n=1 Tax=Teratosphaeria destructans TaxID=418781 RepID=A0A9W7SRZ5_9PEZI|nr:hypothetical protein Tdes44962_MAKER00341 [Teratosphaeria destructans]